MVCVYLAGPDVFLPHAREQAQAKEAICARFGLVGLSPFNPALDVSLPADVLWRRIFADNAALMARSDAVIANLTPFRGASADAGTLVEIGWFWGAGGPARGCCATHPAGWHTHCPTNQGPQNKPHPSAYSPA